MKFLVDTNVLSEVRKRRPAAQVVRWIKSCAPEDLFVSVLSVGELRSGIERLRKRDSRQAVELEAWLEQMRTQFADRILPITPEIAEEWGRLNVPAPLPSVDGLIAATARVHGLTVATRNLADFSRVQLSVLNPFDS